MARRTESALARYQYIVLAVCAGGMVFCWANAALRLYGPGWDYCGSERASPSLACPVDGLIRKRK
jgi:hypothetical protein